MNRFFSLRSSLLFKSTQTTKPLLTISQRPLAASTTLYPSTQRLVKPVTCITRGISGLLSEESSDSEIDTSIDTKIPFSELGLPTALVESLNKLGFKSAFDIQAKTLPHTLSGRNVIGRAITGSGKTLAYALPIVNVLTSTPEESGTPRGLVITPTRELCRQVTECIGNLGMGIRCVALYGGDPYSRQERALYDGVDVVCATPGRLNDHVQRGTLRLDKMKFLVLDEADELLTPNFKEQIEDVLNTVPNNKQMMLFSATMPRDVQRLVQRNMPDPVIVDLTSSSKKVPSSIIHKVMRIDSYNQFGTILDLLRVHSPERSIVFTCTKQEARELGSYLSQHGLRAESLHSDLSQRARESTLSQFRSGRIKVLAATDVAARGIDIPEIELIIQLEAPRNGLDFYIHRSGRTGRKGLPGTSITLLSPSRESDNFIRELRRIVKLEEYSLPPNEEIIKSCLDKAVESVKEDKSSDLMSLALPLAQDLYDKMGVNALASALVHISDAKKPSRYERSRDFGQGDFNRDFGQRDFNRGFGQRGFNRDFGQRDFNRRDFNRDFGQRDFNRDFNRRDYNNDRRSSSQSFDHFDGRGRYSQNNKSNESNSDWNDFTID